MIDGDKIFQSTRTKFCHVEKTVGSYKCGGKHCEVYIKVNETSTFTNTVTEETYIKNHRFDCKMFGPPFDL